MMQLKHQHGPQLPVGRRPEDKGQHQRIVVVVVAKLIKALHGCSSGSSYYPKRYFPILNFAPTGLLIRQKLLRPEAEKWRPHQKW